MKHKDEWNCFVVALKQAYGFHKLCCPMIFTVEGELIGNTDEFYQYSKDKFGKSFNLPKEILQRRAKENNAFMNEVVRKRSKDLEKETIEEKIYHKKIRAAKLDNTDFP